jgi:hypothetical protein
MFTDSASASRQSRLERYQGQAEANNSAGKWSLFDEAVKQSIKINAFVEGGIVDPTVGLVKTAGILLNPQTRFTLATNAFLAYSALRAQNKTVAGAILEGLKSQANGMAADIQSDNPYLRWHSIGSVTSSVVASGLGLVGKTGTLFAGSAGGYGRSLASLLGGSGPKIVTKSVAKDAHNFARNRVQHEAFKADLRQNMQKPVISDAKLQSFIDQLYRPNAKIGSGSTADAVREEMRTGQPVGEKFHAQKSQDALPKLQKWLQNTPTASPGDRAAVENIIYDLHDALGITPRPTFN